MLQAPLSLTPDERWTYATMVAELESVAVRGSDEAAADEAAPRGHLWRYSTFTCGRDFPRIRWEELVLHGSPWFSMPLSRHWHRSSCATMTSCGWQLRSPVKYCEAASCSGDERQRVRPASIHSGGIAHHSPCYRYGEVRHFAPWHNPAQPPENPGLVGPSGRRHLHCPPKSPHTWS